MAEVRARIMVVEDQPEIRQLIRMHGIIHNRTTNIGIASVNVHGAERGRNPTRAAFSDGQADLPATVEHASIDACKG